MILENYKNWLKNTTINRGHSSDVDSGGLPRLTTYKIDIEVRDNTLQPLRKVYNRPAFQFFGVNGIYGSRKVHFLLRTVSYYHNLSNVCKLLLHKYINLIFPGYRNFFGLLPNSILLNR